MNSYPRRRWIWAGVTGVAAALVLSGVGTAQVQAAPVVASDFQAPVGGPFGSRSIWKSDVRSAPLDGISPALVANLAGQVSSRYGGVAAFNVRVHSSSVFTVRPDQARTTLKWDDCQHKGYLPPGLLGPGGHFVDVPVPPEAVPGPGSDAVMTIHQPSSDTLWDFWRVNRQADGWHACWGGRIDKVSQSGGWFPGAFGASASGLALAGGAIGIREAQAGSIGHAVGLAIPDVGSRHRWPAQRTDGTDARPNAVPEGTRFRLDPALDVASLQLHPLAAMVARAAQQYGLVVTDRSGAVSVAVESGAATQAVTGVDPWAALMAGTPEYLVMRNFPWNRLQALPQDYGRH
jgi:hypothetical protein